VFIVVGVYFVIDSVLKLLDTPSYGSGDGKRGNKFGLLRHDKRISPCTVVR